MTFVYFLHTLAFVSASNIDKYITVLFLEGVLIFSIKAHFYVILCKPITITFAVFLFTFKKLILKLIKVCP